MLVLSCVSFKMKQHFYSGKSLISTLKLRHFWKANNPFFHSCLQIIFLLWPYLGQKRPQSFKSLKTCLNFETFAAKTAQNGQKMNSVASFLPHNHFTDLFHEISRTCFIETSTSCGHPGSLLMCLKSVCKELKFLLNRWLL